MKETRAEHLAVDKLRPFEGHPFKVVDNEEMDQLTWSILTQGLLTPLVVRPLPNGEYEVISGHRRLHACKKAGIETVPALITDMDRDAAAIALVDSNLHREKILPSEKAFAYQMRLEAMKRKAGRPSQENSAQFGQNTSPVDSRKELAEQTGESSVQIQRYIRLTELIDPLLEMVDTKAMAMNAGVELSYLKPKEQVAVVEAIKSEDTCPSIEQAKKIRRFNDEGRLNPDVILSIMQEQKADKIKITLGDDKLKKYFPKGYSKQQMEDTIIKLLEKWHRKLEMER